MELFIFRVRDANHPKINRTKNPPLVGFFVSICKWHAPVLYFRPVLCVARFLVIRLDTFFASVYVEIPIERIGCFFCSG